MASVRRICKNCGHKGGLLKSKPSEHTVKCPKCGQRKFTATIACKSCGKHWDL
jgi:uncharacterized Zn finger protein